MLDNLNEYSHIWNIDVNISKTKIVIFRSGGRVGKNDKFSYRGETIEILNSFNYLGLTLNFNGKFTKAQNILAMQGRKCMFKVMNICNDNHLNVETKLHVFDTYVTSILH